MAWQQIVPQLKGATAQTVHFAYSERGGGRLKLASSVAEKLGWKDKEPLQLFVGTDDHKGKLRLVAHKEGALALVASKNKKTFLLRLGRVAPLNQVDFSAEAVLHLVEGRDLTITLPEDMAA